MGKKKAISDIEVLRAVESSENIRECLLKLYENKNPSNVTYVRVSRLMIENGIKFSNGETYVHPSLQTLYEQNSNKSPRVKII